EADLGAAAPGVTASVLGYISWKLALPPALALAAPGARGIFLVKRQFEAGREAIGKGGILRALRHGRRVAEEMAVWLGTNAGWHALGVKDSPIDGGDGNREYLLAGAKAT